MAEVTTTVTEQEKREALARWEGWQSSGEELHAWLDPRVSTVTDEGREYHRVEIEPPDYFRDGNAMLRLLAKAVIEKGCWFKARGVIEQPWEFVLVQPFKDDIVTLAPDLPAAAAEAVWRALTVEELSR